jgi:O-antigen/teichoic acid export membrane protein
MDQRKTLWADSRQTGGVDARDIRQSPNTVRRLGSQVLVVLLGNLFTFAVGLPLQIYVSRVLGAGGLGLYGLLEGGVNTAHGFLNFGLAQTVVRFVPAHLEKGEYAQARRLLRVSSVLLLMVGGLAYAFLLIVLPYLEHFWPELRNQASVVAVMGLMIPLGLLTFFFQQALRGLHEIRYMVYGSSIVQLSVKAAVTVAAFFIGLKLSGYVLATAAAAATGALWMAYGIKRTLDGLPSDAADEPRPFLSEWRRYAVISYAGGLVGAATAYADRFILAFFLGSTAVGVLVILRQLQQFPQMFNQMLLMAGAPMFAAAYARNDSAEREHLYILMTDWVMKASLPLVLFLIMFARPVLALFGPEFAREGASVLWIFILGQIINLASGPIGYIALMSGFESMTFRLTAINAALSVALLVILAPAFGLLGIAITTVATNAFINISIMLVLRRRLGLRWWNRRYLGWLLPSCAAGAIGGAVVYSGYDVGIVALAATLAAMYAAFAAIVFLQGLNEDEKDLLRYLRDRVFGHQIQQ